MRLGWQEPAREPASVDVTDRDPANVLLSRERDEGGRHGFDVDNILERHRTEQRGRSGCDQAPRRAIAAAASRRGAGRRGLRRWSRLYRRSAASRPRLSRSMSAVHARSRVCNAARTIPGKPRTPSIVRIRRPEALVRHGCTQCLAVAGRRKPPARREASRAKSGLQSDFIGRAAPNTHSERQLGTIRKENASYHDPFRLFAIEDGGRVLVDRRPLNGFTQCRATERPAHPFQASLIFASDAMARREAACARQGCRTRLAGLKIGLTRLNLGRSPQLG